MDIFIIISLVLLAAIWVFDYFKSKYKLYSNEQIKQIQVQARSEAIAQSKAVIRGQASEELIILFPDFPHDFTKCKFLGKPIDYIVFGEDEIVLAEVKTGEARTTAEQRRIKDLINDKKVKFEVWQIKEGKIVVK